MRPKTKKALALHLDESARELIQATLADCGNDMMCTAVALGIHYTTLYSKMDRLGIPLPKKGAK